MTALLVSSMPLAVYAQEVPERRPVQPLFGAPDPRGESDGGLSVTGSLFGSYDDNILLSSQGSPTRPPTLPGFGLGETLRGAAVGYDTAVFFKLPSNQPTFEASVVSTGRYFPEFQEYVAGRQMAEASSSVSAEPWRYTNFRLTGSGRYSLNAPPFATAASLSDADVDLPFAGDGIPLRHTNDLRGAAELGLLAEGRHLLRRQARVRRVERRPHRAGRDGVHADPSRQELLSERARERVNGALGG